MKMDRRGFEESVLLHGADLNRWPDGIRQAGTEALRGSPELKTFLVEQEKFERVLQKRKYEEPSGNLAERIVAVSLRRAEPSSFRLGLFLSRLLADEFHFAKPALVMVSILLITALVTGFFIGFSNLSGPTVTEPKEASFREFLHYEEGAL
jgi:hypothetical protein